MPTTSEQEMKTAIREKLLAQLAELERQANGEVTRPETQAVNICSKRAPVVTQDQWETLAKVARDPSIKLRRVAQPPTD